jgi:hypothetical protein
MGAGTKGGGYGKIHAMVEFPYLTVERIRMMDDCILFQDKIFPSRHLESTILGNISVSTTELNELIMDSNGEYTSKEAVDADEEILFFVSAQEIMFVDNELIDLIQQELYL